MTSPADRGSDGMYTHPVTGEKFPSYSSVMNMLSKPGLMYWAANRVADAQVHHFDKIIAHAVDLCGKAFDEGKDLHPTDAYYHSLRGAPWRERDEKADLGTAVHAAIEAYQADARLDWPDDVAPFMHQFEGFLRDYRPHIIANEVTVYNRTIGYAGTLDMLASLRSPQLDMGEMVPGLAIIDVKTGKDVYPDAAVQQNAYANGEVFFDPWEQKDIDMPRIEKAYVLHVRPTFYKLIPVTLSQENFDVFCALRNVWDWDKNSKKAALGTAKAVKVK